jgi:ATP-binding cassette subfamily C protein CydC
MRSMSSTKGTFWRLVCMARPVGGWMALAALIGGITIACGVGLMATSAYLISAAALHPSIAALSVAIVGVRFFGIARGVARYLERLVSHHATFRLLASIRVWLYDALEPLAPARLQAYAHAQGMGYRSGDLLSRIVSDIDTLQNMYIRVLAPPVVAALVAAGMWWLLGAFDPVLALAFIAFFLLSAAGVPLLAYVLSRRPARRFVQVKAELNAQVVDAVQGMADVVAFGQESQQAERIGELNDTLTRQQMSMARIGSLQNFLSNLFMNLAAWIMLILAVPLVRSGQLNGVYLALLVLAALAGFEAVQQLPTAFQQLGGTLEAAQRLFEIVDAQPDVHDSPQASPRPECYDLELQHVRFAYQPDEAAAIDDISFVARPGECIALVGPSGAGKSTIAQLLQRFWEYQGGHILLGGYELRQYQQEDVRRLISVVAQDTHLFNTTVRENLRLARPEASFEEIVEAARKAQIHETIQALPHGYDTQIGEQGLLLSGGERQRIAIARAFLKNAPVLILDEATAHLDALTEQAVLRSLRKLMRERTAIMITHRLIDLELADEILVLSAGKIVERGKHHDLIQKEGYYWHMWKRQQNGNRVLSGWGL